MNPRVSYPLVGAFVLLLGAATLAATLWLAGAGERKDYTAYVAYFRESVSGLNTGATVKYRGVGVGQVRAIALDRDNPERVRLLLDIETGTPIKEDTVALIASQGITGLSYVELTGGNRESPALTSRDGERYAEIRTGPSLFLRFDTAISRLLEELTGVAGDLSSLVERVDGLLSKDKEQSIANTLVNVEQITTALATRVSDFSAYSSRMEIILHNAARASEQMPAVVAQVRTTLDSVAAAVRAVDAAANSLAQLAQSTQREMEHTSSATLGDLAPMLAELRQASASLRRLSEGIERNPEALLFGRDRRPGPGEQP
ncbi:MAG: MCE family protein [Gammaproteobacteria bacterium]|nr:MCE family protein [Gammaproteobacteria bacterium]